MSTPNPEPRHERNQDDDRPAPVSARYQLIERVAWREEREVWRARQTWPPRPVALKLSHDLAQLRREAAALVQVGPPAVPEVIEVGTITVSKQTEPIPGLASEWIDGLPIVFDPLTLPAPPDRTRARIARGIA